MFDFSCECRVPHVYFNHLRGNVGVVNKVRSIYKVLFTSGSAKKPVQNNGGTRFLCDESYFSHQTIKEEKTIQI